MKGEKWEGKNYFRNIINEGVEEIMLNVEGWFTPLQICIFD